MKNTLSVGCEKCLDENVSVLETIDIINHFQPIISVAENKIIAYESLCRGICKHCNTLIPPLELFKKAKDKSERLNIDLIARYNAIAKFSELSCDKDNTFLFLNFDADLIENKVDSPQMLLDVCKRSGTNPNNIVVEITESKPCSINMLKEFVEECRKNKFLVAFDDVGTGYSNFDRISVTKPDIIKLDRSIISDLDKDYHKKVIFRSMARLAEKLGILLLAEGVETSEEAVYSIELGAELLQGFYFSKPIKIDPNEPPALREKLHLTENLYKEYKIKRIKNLKNNHKIYQEAINHILDHLSSTVEEEFDSLLASHIEEHQFIESLYIIDNTGIQITNSHTNTDACQIKPKIFKLLQKGDSHYYEEYFYILQEGIFPKFTTNTYYSHITGYLCKTLSIKFTSLDQKEYVFCMNIKE